MRNTILLINPPLKPYWEFQEGPSTYPPMGILYIGTLLKNNGYHVIIIDGAREKNYLQLIKDTIGRENVLSVGLSVMTAQILPALKTSQYVRQCNPSIKIVWGGIHPTLFPEQTCQDDLIDIVVIREGERTCLDLAGAISSNKSLYDVKGIAYKNREGKVIVTEERELADIDQIPSFNFDLVDIERYINKDMSHVGGKDLPGGSKRRTLPILAGLGCSFKCAFCINAILKKKHRRKKAALIVQEIEFLMNKYKANDFSMIDEDFFIDRKRVEEFLNLLEKKKIQFSWSAGARANYFTDSYLNERFLNRLKQNGFYHTGFGAESGSEKILQLIHKGITPDQTKNAALLSKKCGINFCFSFMCALPGETEKEILQTILFCHKLIQLNPDNYIIGPQVFRPYPGSPLYDAAVQCGLITPSNLTEWGKVYNDIEGYFRLENLPWVKNPKKIRKYLFYLHFTYQKVLPLKKWKKMLFPILRFFSNLRFELNFFGFPWEYFVFKTILKKEI